MVELKHTCWFTWTQTIIVSGMEGTMLPSAGAHGIRLVIDRPDVIPDPSMNGIDIPPGFTTLIGIKGREIKRLHKPYSDCSEENKEINRLVKIVENEMNISKDDNSSIETWRTAYQVVDCRGACLNRLIFEQCNCLDLSLNMPVVDASLLCANPGEGGKKLFNFGGHHSWDNVFIQII